jgi:glucosyl-dolichyl phosphate glucuronosyltransferase
MIEASVVICAYTMDRWAQLGEAVASVRAQSAPAREILVVIDGNEELRQRADRELDGVTVLPNSKAPGLSGGRMTGTEHATAPVIVFLDDDAIADPGWLKELLAAYEDPRVLGAGGYIEPMWSTAAPRWFPSEFYWVIGCTYTGMPVRDGRIRNPIGANMSVRAEVLHRAGGFASKLGRREGNRLAGGVAESCEETEFCIRATRLHPGGFWAYRPKARVRHYVPPQRMTWRYFVRRCRMEGTAKAVLTSLTGTKEGLGSERRYVLSLVRAVIRELCQAKPRRAAAICLGFGITGYAYVRTRFTRLEEAENSPASLLRYGTRGK